MIGDHTARYWAPSDATPLERGTADGGGRVAAIVDVARRPRGRSGSDSAIHAYVTADVGRGGRRPGGGHPGRGCHAPRRRGSRCPPVNCRGHNAGRGCHRDDPSRQQNRGTDAGIQPWNNRTQASSLKLRGQQAPLRAHDTAAGMPPHEHTAKPRQRRTGHTTSARRHEGQISSTQRALGQGKRDQVCNACRCSVAHALAGGPRGRPRRSAVRGGTL